MTVSVFIILLLTRLQEINNLLDHTQEGANYTFGNSTVEGVSVKEEEDSDDESERDSSDESDEDEGEKLRKIANICNLIITRYRIERK